MAERPKLGPLSPPPLPGAVFLAEYKAGMKGLFDAASFPLTAVGGTPNDVTASLEWDLDAGLVDGMMFSLTWGANNTGPMTLSINGAAPVNVLSASGGVMIQNGAVAGTRAIVEFVAGSFRVLSGGGESAGGQRFYQDFTASGTWLKPAGLPDNTIVTVEAWGGGGGGSTSTGSFGAGGGGGGYAIRRMRIADLPSSVSVVVGAGGAAGNNNRGGNSTFGTLLTAYGGGGANGGTSGGGAGALSAGASPGGGTLGGGVGGTGSGTDGTGFGGGAGGGAPTVGAAGSGGNSLWGGGGGAGLTSGAAATPGLSVYGGAGGAANVAGSAPGGGGGRFSAGARGQVRVTI